MKKVIEDFKPQGGKHCITSSLKQIFNYYGYPLSEEMMFGLASGLSFIYINQSSSPMVNGRTKIFEFEKKLAERLNITIKCKTDKNYKKVFDTTKHMIDSNHPVLIYVDMPFLKYLQMDSNSHFGGHAVVLFGYDDRSKSFWLSDRDHHDYPIRIPNGTIQSDYHVVHYDELEKARSSSYRPFPANHKYLIFNFHGYKQVDKTMLMDAMKETCDTMLHPPAQLLGIHGILKFSKEILKWKKFTLDKLKLAGTTNYFQINQDGGTGGGIFRKMYGEFLIEASHIMNEERIATIGEKFIKVSTLWDEIAEELWELSQTGNIALLEKMSNEITQLYNLEKQLYESLAALIDECRRS